MVLSIKCMEKAAKRLPHSFFQESAMIDLYYWTTPNGHKITIFLEETGLPYKIKPVNIGKGDQFKPEFLAISPNNRIPAIVDHAPADGGAPLSLFESGAILNTSPRRPGSCCRATCASAGNACSGFTGRWVGSARSPGRITISVTT